MLRVQMVIVAAVTEGDWLRLVDRKGRRIQARVKREWLGKLDVSASEHLTWQGQLERQIGRLQHHAKAHGADPWIKRAKNMAFSIRLRQKDRPPKAGHKQFDKWKSTNWHDACIRMVEQAHNHFRNRLQSPWKLWANQVAKNQQKRVESRYGKSNYSITNT
jgi:hypothetical protein